MRFLFLIAFLLSMLFARAQRGDNHFAVWAGFNGSNFHQTSPSKETSQFKYGYSLFIGMRNYFDAWPDLLIGYQQKGGYSTRPVITTGGTGSETFAVDLNYLSLDLPFKKVFSFGASRYARVMVGPYMDYLVGMQSHAKFANDQRTIGSFKKFNLGLMYGFDITFYSAKYVGLGLGIYGQNGLTKAGDDTGASFRNNTYAALLTFAFAF